MSTIIGAKQDDVVYIGCDSRLSTEDGGIRPATFSKVFRNGDYLFGISGSARGGQLLTNNYFDPPKDVKDLPNAIINLFEENGFLRYDDQVYVNDTNLLIAHKGKLYEMLGDFFMAPVVKLTAVGSGAMIALGAMSALEIMGVKDAQKRINTALKIAAMYDAATGEPFSVKSI